MVKETVTKFDIRKPLVEFGNMVSVVDRSVEGEHLGPRGVDVDFGEGEGKSKSRHGGFGKVRSAESAICWGFRRGCASSYILAESLGSVQMHLRFPMSFHLLDSLSSVPGILTTFDFFVFEVGG